MTGIPVCARVTSGQATAPPTKEIKLRLFTAPPVPDRGIVPAQTATLGWVKMSALVKRRHGLRKSQSPLRANSDIKRHGVASNLTFAVTAAQAILKEVWDGDFVA